MEITKTIVIIIINHDNDDANDFRMRSFSEKIAHFKVVKVGSLFVFPVDD